VALEGRSFGGKLAEVECGARIGVSFGLTGSLIFECCGASRFAVQQALAPQKILPQPTCTIASADDRDANPRTYDFRDGTAERREPSPERP
jgi:hypothetical protein